jgi:hypothetical protein
VLSWAILLNLLAVFALVPLIGMSEESHASQQDPNVVIQIQSPRPNQRVQGVTEIKGVAYDLRGPRDYYPDLPSINNRDVQVYLDESSSQSLLSYAPNDIAESGRYARHMAPFRLFWDMCTVPPGRHTVIVWVSSNVVLGARQMASVSVENAGCGNRLAAPRLVAPANGALLSSRFSTDMTLVWSAVPGAASYALEVHVCGWEGRSQVQSCNDDWADLFLYDERSTTRFEGVFMGAQPGRWRVWAIDAAGIAGRMSEWWTFSYEGP